MCSNRTFLCTWGLATILFGIRRQYRARRPIHEPDVGSAFQLVTVLRRLRAIDATHPSTDTALAWQFLGAAWKAEASGAYWRAFHAYADSLEADPAFVLAQEGWRRTLAMVAALGECPAVEVAIADELADSVATNHSVLFHRKMQENVARGVADLLPIIRPST